MMRTGLDGYACAFAAEAASNSKTAKASFPDMFDLPTWQLLRQNSQTEQFDAVVTKNPFNRSLVQIEVSDRLDVCLHAVRIIDKIGRVIGAEKKALGTDVGQCALNALK